MGVCSCRGNTWWEPPGFQLKDQKEEAMNPQNLRQAGPQRCQSLLILMPSALWNGGDSSFIEEKLRTKSAWGETRVSLQSIYTGGCDKN